jgi:hypothetical protein
LEHRLLQLLVENRTVRSVAASTLVTSSLVLSLAACEVEWEESVGEEVRETIDATDEGMDEVQEQADDILPALVEPRSPLEKRIDEMSREMDAWAESIGKDLDPERQKMLEGLRNDLAELKRDVESHVNAAGDDVEAAQQTLEERADVLGDEIDGLLDGS